MKISDITRFLESLAPLHFQEDYDNSGLQLGVEEAECRGILISLDTTEAIIEEAAQRGCNLVISHHPLIFHGLTKISGKKAIGRAAIAAIRQEITIYAIHTNLDNVLPGVNSAMADQLGLINRRFLQLKPVLEKEEERPAGSGLVGDLPLALEETQFLQLIRQKFRVPVIRHSRLTGRAVQRVALCGGAGSFLITNALMENADFFISSDIRYHQFFEAEEQLVIADIGHYESEQFTIDLLYEIILEKFPNFAVLKAGSPTNPVHYYL